MRPMVNTSRAWISNIRRHISSRRFALASEKLAQAAAIIDREPSAITLRYLQTLTEIASEQNSTIVFPLPMELMRMMRPGEKGS